MRCDAMWWIVHIRYFAVAARFAPSQSNIGSRWCIRHNDMVTIKSRRSPWSSKETECWFAGSPNGRKQPETWRVLTWEKGSIHFMNSFFWSSGLAPSMDWLANQDGIGPTRLSRMHKSNEPFFSFRTFNDLHREHITVVGMQYSVILVLYATMRN